MLLALLICAFFLWYFHLDGAAVDYKNPSLVIKFLFTLAFLPLGLYFRLYFLLGNNSLQELRGRWHSFLYSPLY